MGLFNNLKAKLNGDWCGSCKVKMEEARQRLFALPTMRVGHYCDHENADYYLKNLVPIFNKSEVPVGMYACRLIEYRCPQCGRTLVKACPFLPVRDAERVEIAHIFKNGELDSLFQLTD